MIIPFDLNIFKRTNIVNSENIGRKSDICDQIDESSHKELTDYCKKILAKSVKLIFNKLSELNDNKSSEIRRELYNSYTKKINDSQEAISVIEKLLEFEDLIDFKINISTIAKISKKYKNPMPFKMTDYELFELVLLLMETDSKIDIVKSFAESLQLPNNTSLNESSEESNDSYSKQVIKKNLENYTGIKYWQLSVELAHELSNQDTDLTCFFDGKLKEHFVIPYVTEYIQSDKQAKLKDTNTSKGNEKTKKIKSFFGAENWETIANYLKTIVDKENYPSIYNDTTASKVSWKDSLIFPDEYSWVALNNTEYKGQTGGVTPAGQQRAGPAGQQRAGPAGQQPKKKLIDKADIFKKWAVPQGSNWEGSLSQKTMIKENYEKKLKNPFTDRLLKPYVKKLHETIDKDKDKTDRIYIKKMIDVPNQLYKNMSLFFVDFIEDDFIDDIKVYTDYRKRFLNKLIEFYKICIYELCNLKSRLNLTDKEKKQGHNVNKRNGTAKANGVDNGTGRGRGTGRGNGRGNGRGTGRGNGRGNGRGTGRGNGRGNGRGTGRGNGRGNGRGTGRGTGRGNGRGTGRGNGRGTGRGNGRGNGRGTGRGNGRGTGRGTGRGNGRGN
jgi:hypothetical protein